MDLHRFTDSHAPAALVMALAAVGASACHRASGTQAAGSSSATPARGARVVVEQTAAEFYEGQVLGSSPGFLRVQTSDGAETRKVAIEDAYLLPPAGHAFQAGELAICRQGAGHWVGCRIVRDDKADPGAVDPDGAALHPGPGGVIAPTPVTLMNLRQRFEREHERHDFLLSVRRAGRPFPPNGWHPSAHERVLAERGSRWYSADVREIDHDTLHVVWRSDARESEVPASAVVPEPPQDEPVHVGDYVLLRPPSLAAAWQPCRVASASEGSFVVVDVEGLRRTVDARDVTPLRP